MPNVYDRLFCYFIPRTQQIIPDVCDFELVLIFVSYLFSACSLNAISPVMYRSQVLMLYYSFIHSVDHLCQKYFIYLIHTSTQNMSRGQKRVVESHYAAGRVMVLLVSDFHL